MALEIKGQAIPNIPWQELPAGMRPRHVALLGQPRDTPRPSADIQQHLQLGRGALWPRRLGICRSVQSRRHQPPHAHSFWILPRRHQLAYRRIRRGADRSRSRNSRLGIWLRSARGAYRRPLLGDLVQRLSRPHYRSGLDEDFRTFHQLENAFLPYNRNGVLFPAR